MGACLQSLLMLILPARYALPAAALVLLLRFFDKLSIVLGLRPNPDMKDVIMKKVSAQVPDRNGNHSTTEIGGEKIVVFLLGFKSNHPFGLFAPGFREVGDYFQRMVSSLGQGAAENGCKSTRIPCSPQTYIGRAQQG